MIDRITTAQLVFSLLLARDEARLWFYSSSIPILVQPRKFLAVDGIIKGCWGGPTVFRFIDVLR